jgi:hypothetical protein
MHTSPPNFVDDVVVPIRVISTGEKIEDEENMSAEVHQFSTLEQVESHFSRTTHSYNFVYVLPEHYTHGSMHSADRLITGQYISAIHIGLWR